jgi:hypothetical protein
VVCEGEPAEGGKRLKDKRKISSTRSFERKSGNFAEVVGSFELGKGPGFLNLGCASQDFWITGRGTGRSARCFPHLPQVCRKGLWIAAGLCEKAVRRRIEKRVLVAIRSTMQRFPQIAQGVESVWILRRCEWIRKGGLEEEGS